MPTYIALFQFTQQGAQHIKDLPNRVEKNRESMQRLGVELKSWHVTMGEYDVVAVVDAPNDEAVAKLALSICQQGNARSQTMRAFSLEEFKKISAALP
jgi:uncharacterized protein with GYD domain